MMILVTGGASSGKSACAETLACALPGSHYYLAAMKPFGEEGARRIARHRALRAGKGFVTVECWNGLRDLTAADCGLADSEDAGESGQPVGIGDGWRSAVSVESGLSAGVVESGRSAGVSEQSVGVRESEEKATALLESLGNVVANELFADDGTCVSYEDALRGVLDGVAYVSTLFDNLVIVGDEVGADGLRYDEQTEVYIRLIGSAACAIAASCDVVIECVAGQPTVVKGSIEGLALQ